MTTTTRIAAIIEPCPFCGCDGTTSRRAAGWIACCSARHISCPVNGRTHHSGTEAEAIDEWNTRHDAAHDLLEALVYAVEQYGKPGGPWNVPSDPGGWLDRARNAITKARGPQ